MTILQQATGTWTGSSFTATLPGASSSSNIVAVVALGDVTVTTPSGWALRTSQVNWVGHYLFDRAGGSTSYGFTTGNGQGTWWIFEIEGGTYDTSASANNTSSATTYGTPSLTPASGDRHLIANIGCDAVGGPRSITSWSNSFTEVAEVGGNSFHLQGGASLFVTASGGSYSTTATYSSSVVGKSAIIASYGYGSSGGTTHALTSTGTGTSGGSLAVRLTLSAGSTGTGTSAGSAALSLTPGALSASGSGATAGSANLNAALALSASGAGSTAGSVDLTITGGATTHALAATGTSSSTGSLAVNLRLRCSSTGTGATLGSAALLSTLRLSSIGTGQSTGSAALGLRMPLAATGAGGASGSAALVILEPANIHALAATGSAQMAGSLELTLVEPTFLFSPPTHEGPIRVEPQGPFRVLAYHRMTYANSLVKVGDTWTAMRVPPAELVAQLEEGVTFFRGGYEYQINRDLAAELELAGLLSVPSFGYGMGAYGAGPYGD